MSTRRWLLAAAGLGVAAVWLWSQTRPPAPAVVASASPPPSAHERVFQPAAPHPHVTRSPELHDSPAAAAPDPFVEDGALLRARFANERADTSWAIATRAQLETDLGRFGGKDASVRTVECRSSMCKVEVAVASNDAGAAFMQSWLRERAFDGPGYVTQGDGTMVMYLGRPGTEFLSR